MKKVDATTDAMTRIRATSGLMSKIAKSLSVRLPSVSGWRRVPPGRVLAVESITGIDRTVLRPDLYPPALTRKPQRSGEGATHGMDR